MPGELNAPDRCAEHIMRALVCMAHVGIGGGGVCGWVHGCVGGGCLTRSQLAYPTRTPHTHNHHPTPHHTTPPPLPRAGIMEMLEHKCREKGISFEEWFEGLKVGTSASDINK